MERVMHSLGFLQREKTSALLSNVMQFFYADDILLRFGEI